jgi:hypothetical protein
LNGESYSWVEPDTTNAWYSNFRSWITSCKDVEAKLGAATASISPECVGKSLDTDGYVPEAKFYTWLKEFLDTRGGALFGVDLILDNDDAPTKINAARFRSTYVAVGKATEQVKSMEDMRVIVNRVEIEGSFPYMFMYLYYEQFAIIGSEAVTNISLALLAVSIVTFTLLSNFWMGLLVMTCVLLVDIDLLGLMYFWGLSIDSVCVVNLVLAIGLAVDYTMHIAHVFITTPGERLERAKYAVESMGSSVLHGATSTFLAVLMLSQSQSYIFVSFFKMFFGIVLFGLLHGMVFMPVVAGICGPRAIGEGGGNKNAKVMQKVGPNDSVEESKEGGKQATV